MNCTLPERDHGQLAYFVNGTGDMDAIYKATDFGKKLLSFNLLISALS